MEFTQLGQTDLRVSRLAFGTWSFGGEVGARTPSQIEQTAAAADIYVGTADVAQIGRIMKNAVPVGGPAPETV